MIIDKCLYGDFVYLRSVEISDAEFTYRIRQNSDKNTYLHPVNQGIDNQVNWIRKQRERDGDYFFVAVSRANQCIGTGGIYNIKDNSGEMGRLLMMGNQIETLETCLLLHDFAFYDLKLNLIISYILEGNKPALGVNKRFGGTEVSRKFDVDFQMDMIRTDITIEAYTKEREKLVKLLNRFKNR